MAGCEAIEGIGEVTRTRFDEATQTWYAEAPLEAMGKLSQENFRLKEALIWTSGSPSFAPEGEARKGWEKLVRPLILGREA